MAIGWLTLLKSVPWVEVIGNAPKIAEGARKFWRGVGTPAPAPSSPGNGSDPVDSQAALQARLAAAETAVAELHQQMRASAELIKELADQNGRLIAHIETTRLRLRWLTLSLVLLAAVAGAALFIALGG